MEIVQEKIDDLNAVLKVKVAPDDYKVKYNEGLKNYRKNVSIPGFRPGNVPMGLVKKKYGPSILADEINKLVNDQLYSHIQENDLNILGNPMPKEGERGGDWENPGDFEFNYEIGLAPEFQVKLSSKDKYDYYLVKVDDEMLNKEVENMRRRYGKLVAVEESGATDLILGQFVELDENGAPKEGGIMHSATVSVEYLDDPEMQGEMTGMKVGDTKVVDPKRLSKGDADLAAMLGIKSEEVGLITTDFNFTVTEIKRMDMADLDQEFFDKVFGEGNVTSEQELKDKVQEDLSRMFVRDSDRMLQRDVSEKLVDKLGLPLPDAFLKRWIQRTNEKPVTMDQIEGEYEAYSNSLRWQLIENQLIKENDIKVENEEVLNYTKGLIANNFAQYGMPVPDDAELTQNAENVLQNREEAERIYKNIYDAKILEFFKNTVKLVEKEVSYDDFVKLASRES